MKIFDSYDEFEKAVGLITDDEILKQIGATAAIGTPDNGKFCTSLLKKIEAFCRKNPQYHIATETSDSDECEFQECVERARKQGLEWSEMSREEQNEFRSKEDIFCTTIDNSIRFVNRMHFYLAGGNADPELSLIEVSPS